MRAMRGADVFPLVELSSAPMKTKMGTKSAPRFVWWGGGNLEMASAAQPP